MSSQTKTSGNGIGFLGLLAIVQCNQLVMVVGDYASLGISSRMFVGIDYCSDCMFFTFMFNRIMKRK